MSFISILTHVFRSKKNNRKVITPDDIENLFAKENSDNTETSYSKNDGLREMKAARDVDLNDEDGDENEEKSYSVMKSLFDSSNEGTPKWLDDALKEQKQAAKKRRRKEKGLLDDWRFWGAVIVTAAFASAWYTVSQQTGASFSGISLPGSNTELVI